MDIYSLSSDYNRREFDYEAFIRKMQAEGRVTGYASERGNPIYAVRFGKAPRIIASFAGVHGSETGSIRAGKSMLLMLSEGRLDEFLDDVSYIGVPCLNPDGELLFQRKNAKGVNISLDFDGYGPLHVFRAAFRSKEARVAKEIIDENCPAVVLDHHTFQRKPFDFETYEGCRPLEREIAFNVRKALRRWEGRPENVVACGEPSRRMLADYASRMGIPSVIFDSGIALGAEPHIIADVEAIRSFRESLKAGQKRSFSSPRNVPSSR